MKKVTFESQSQIVEGTLFLPESNGIKFPSVIFFHGSGSSESRYFALAEALVKNNIAALTLNLRGHSSHESLKNATAYDGISDALAAYDFLTKTN